MKCIICKGTGIMPNKKLDLKTKEKLAIRLRQRGCTYREVCLALGYKSPRSIQKIEAKLLN